MSNNEELNDMVIMRINYCFFKNEHGFLKKRILILKGG